MATLVRWQPLDEMTALQNEMNRFLGSLLSTKAGNGDNSWAKTWAPSVDVWETDTELVYAFDLPGIPEDQISIELDDGALTVSGERARSEQVADERFYRYERRFGSFTRTIGVPQGVGEGDVKASYENGVLEVHVAKPETPKPRRIPIGGEKATIEGTSTHS
jgi:HSP20 family protein